MTTHTTEIVSYRRGNTTGTRWRWVCSCKREGDWEHSEANAQWSADQHVRRATHDGPCHRCGEQTVAVEAGRRVVEVEAEPTPEGWWVVVGEDGGPIGRPAQPGDKMAWMSPHGWPGRVGLGDDDLPRHHLHDCRHTPAHKRLMEGAGA